MSFTTFFLLVAVAVLVLVIYGNYYERNPSIHVHVGAAALAMGIIARVFRNAHTPLPKAY